MVYQIVVTAVSMMMERSCVYHLTMCLQYPISQKSA